MLAHAATVMAARPNARAGIGYEVAECVELCRSARGDLIDAEPPQIAPEADPTANLKFTLPRKKRKLDWYRQEEIPQLIATAKAAYPKWWVLVLLLLKSGIRIGEALTLQRGDIDWRGHRIHVRRTVSTRKQQKLAPPKGGKDRWVDVTPSVLVELKAHLEAVQLEGEVQGWTAEQRQWVFPSLVGTYMAYKNFVARVWKPLLRKAGLPYKGIHALRHSYATFLLEHGTDIRYVQRLLPV